MIPLFLATQLVNGILGQSQKAKQEDENQKAALASSISKKGPVQPQQMGPAMQIPSLGSAPGTAPEAAPSLSEKAGVIDPWAEEEKKKQAGGSGILGNLISGILGSK